MATRRVFAMCKLSPQLSKVIGKKKATRPEVLKDVWVYIKNNNLQNPLNKKEVLADDTLKDLFGQDKATVPEVMKLISPHIFKAQSQTKPAKK
mmetsp:Transcript_13454/g.22065  ORF Transcript_13454/g.22065 Transcript_13454/m.22065 type:complete len:93 (-) Transcript_13454:271-549(-)